MGKTVQLGGNGRASKSKSPAAKSQSEPRTMTNFQEAGSSNATYPLNYNNNNYYYPNFTTNEHSKRPRVGQDNVSVGNNQNNINAMPSLLNLPSSSSTSTNANAIFHTLDFSDLIQLDEPQPTTSASAYSFTSEPSNVLMKTETLTLGQGTGTIPVGRKPDKEILVITISDDDEPDEDEGFEPYVPLPFNLVNKTERNPERPSGFDNERLNVPVNSPDGGLEPESHETGLSLSEVSEDNPLNSIHPLDPLDPLSDDHQDRSGRARIVEGMSASAASGSGTAASETKILLTFEDTTCSFCTFPLKVGKGIVVQDCLHPFCKPCLVTWIENAQSVSIKCPVDCGAMLLESEVKALVKPRVFEKLEKLSYEKILSDAPNAFRCQSLKCSGLCFFDEGSKVFLCPKCEKSNCIPCKAIHSGFTCEEYEFEKKKVYELKIKNPEKYLREVVEKKNQTNGFEQLVASGWVSTAMGGPGGDQDKTKMYDTLISSMAQQRIFITSKEFECTICYCDVPKGGGVILQDCIHLFCKDCLISHVEHNDDPQVECPHTGCSSILSPREISALLPADVLEKVNKRSWSLAESIIGSKFHCLTVDCSGFCELEGNVIAFQCPLCLKTNCIQCNAIHENMSCSDFKNQLKQNENDQLSSKAVENLIAKGDAMRCTKCTAPVQKDQGCDWVVCPMCRTELCWATKGPRWGPKGTGDFSGGCKCRVGGKLCHPKCRNCH